MDCSHEKENHGVYTHCAKAQMVQVFVVAHKNADKQRGEQFKQQSQSDAGTSNQKEALFKKIVQLCLVFRAIVKADNRGDAHRIADKNCRDEKSQIQQHSVGGDTVISDVANQLVVIQNSHD